jgi:MoaA/NifB/PqqE/SkfB family radical SAM enzyme
LPKKLRNNKCLELLTHTKPADITVLTINETWYCPVKCPYCHITLKASLEDTRKLETEDLISACKEANRIGINQYRFSGGEPTIVGETLFEHAKIVTKITGKKPLLLTSGFNLSEEWCSEARNLFSGIYISAESPIKPFHSVIKPEKILHFIKQYSTKSLPLQLGITLIKPECYPKLYEIFSYLYEGADRKTIPQLSSPSLKNYISPTMSQLRYLKEETEKIFANFGIIPYYFSEFVGSLLHIRDKANRFVINLNPYGKFHPFSSLKEGLQRQVTLRKRIMFEKIEKCRECAWKDCCHTFDGGIINKIPYFSICSTRKTIYQGILDGLEIFVKK